MTCSVYLCEDHQIVIDGILRIFSNSKKYKPVQFYKSAEALSEALEQKAPDILLLDLNLPDRNGIELLPEIRSRYPNTGILILTMHHDPVLIKKVREMGAGGYLLKDFGEKELLEAMDCITNGGIYFKNLPYTQKEDDLDAQALFLTAREKEIIQLTVSGKTSAEIAAQLFLSPHTVNTHRRNIYKKLNLSNMKALITYAYSNGLA
ncbi:response regulator transcription factor [Balneolaceae bacterium ANBcel3]|nr:response regulator transcription factor [Balneolaceae bacterium ANBcel3]